MKLMRAVVVITAISTIACLAGPAIAGKYNDDRQYFERIATFPVYLNTDIDLETVAEIVDVSRNGKTLVYTDSEQELVGFVDIKDPAAPQADGTVAVGGEPTSVAVAGKYALVAVNTSEDFVNTSGHLRVVHMKSRKVIRDIELGGQPDSISVSPDGQYAAIAIENERDEDLGSGEPPQAPPGFLVIIDIKGHPRHWGKRVVDLVGVPDKFPEDPEPEYVDINRFNIAAVTMQENNHIALVKLRTGKVIKDFPAGSVDLDLVDTNENDLIELKDSLTDVPREPDGLVWINPFQLATADEGDLDGGSRGFTIFNMFGKVRYTSGNSNDHMAARLGHYPEGRSENKGNEPENVEYARFGKNGYLFVGSERSSVVFVYKMDRWMRPRYHQTLPAGLAPEGLKAIPERGLFVAASEDDAREDKFRSALTIYKLSDESTYPTVMSADSANGTPIPWGALSALAYHPAHDNLYSVYDSFYTKSRIFSIDHSQSPALIQDEIVLNDSNGLVAAASGQANEDGTVDLDPEGLSIAQDGSSFWLASEGSGTFDDPKRPIASPNMLVKVAADGEIIKVVVLPDALNEKQLRFGFEGVSSVEEDGVEILYVAFQREWKGTGDPSKHVRIGRYDTSTDAWTFAYYEIDAATSPNGGWVGLSEIVDLGARQFAVIERDNQAGNDARTKKIYQFSIADVDFLETPDATNPDNVISANEKIQARDLIADGDLTRLNGQIIEKVEGLAALPGGKAVIVTDNDGVDDSRGETQLLKLPAIFW
jgi:hypothetical protein